MANHVFSQTQAYAFNGARKPAYKPGKQHTALALAKLRKCLAANKGKATGAQLCTALVMGNKAWATYQANAAQPVPQGQTAIVFAQPKKQAGMRQNHADFVAYMVKLNVLNPVSG